MSITCSLFPKFFQDLDPAGLVALSNELNLDTINAVVRDGYWIEQSNLANSCSAFCKAMRDNGINVFFATAACLDPYDLINDPSPLQILWDNGITHVRVGYFSRNPNTSVADTVADVKSCVEQLSDVASKIGIKCIVQLHHGRLLTNPSLAWHVSRETNPAYFGIMADTGNQCHEGMDNWQQSLSLLGPHLAAIGIKNARPTFDDNNVCRRHWVPLPEGEVDFPTFADVCKNIGFEGPFIFMPFYHQDNAALLKQNLIAEISYFRDLF